MEESVKRTLIFSVPTAVSGRPLEIRGVMIEPAKPVRGLVRRWFEREFRNDGDVDAMGAPRWQTVRPNSTEDLAVSSYLMGRAAEGAWALDILERHGVPFSAEELERQLAGGTIAKRKMAELEQALAGLEAWGGPLGRTRYEGSVRGFLALAADFRTLFERHLELSLALTENGLPDNPQGLRAAFSASIEVPGDGEEPATLAELGRRLAVLWKEGRPLDNGGGESGYRAFSLFQLDEADNIAAAILDGNPDQVA